MNLALKAVLLATVAGALTTTAFAAGTTKAAMPGVVVDSTHSWDGMFVGGFIGYGVGFADQTGPNPPSGPYPAGGVDISLRGGLVGVTAGKNFSVGNGIVLGVVGDVALSTLGGSYFAPGTFNPFTNPGPFYNGTTQNVNAEGSLRGRIGFDAGGILPYLTAGLAVASSTRVSSTKTLVAVAGQAGYTVGAGVEFALSGNSTVNLEYRYTNYGSATYVWQNNPQHRDNPIVGTTTQTVTVGMNWGF